MLALALDPAGDELVDVRMVRAGIFAGELEQVLLDAPPLKEQPPHDGPMRFEIRALVDLEGVRAAHPLGHHDIPPRFPEVAEVEGVDIRLSPVAVRGVLVLPALLQLQPSIGLTHLAGSRVADVERALGVAAQIQGAIGMPIRVERAHPLREVGVLRGVRREADLADVDRRAAQPPLVEGEAVPVQVLCQVADLDGVGLAGLHRRGQDGIHPVFPQVGGLLEWAVELRALGLGADRGRTASVAVLRVVIAGEAVTGPIRRRLDIE